VDPARDRGSVSIEFVGTIPILIVVAILLIEGLLLASAVEDTTKAARDAARVASRGDDGAAAARASLPGWARLERVDVGAGAAAGCVGICSTVEVSVPMGVPGLIELGRVTLTRSADFAAG
jgi:hypothetical protein